MIAVNKTYSVDINKNFDLGKLKSTWQALENKNKETSFFHSWAWLETWLQIYSPELLLVSAEYEGETVALGLFGISRETRHLIVTSNQARLLQTGDAREDQIWVEFNDFLCHPDHVEGATEACLSELLSQKHQYDEIIISMMPASRAENLLKTFPHSNVSLSAPTFKTNLRQLSANEESYLGSLSRNTRYQINRSNKKLETLYGALKLTIATNTELALEYWEEAGKLHKKRWPDSGFQNPQFVNFHKTFIMKNFASGMIDMVRITAGNHLVAIIYNIIYKKNVYFYLQGLHYETDNKVKPGLSAHSILIEYYLQQGMDAYDFMGGYSQYKKQLSDAAENLLKIKIQKPLLRFRMENFARTIRHKMLEPDKNT